MDSTTSAPRYPSVVDRYYTRKYKTNVNSHPGEDQCLLVHSNKICVMTLAESHPIVKEGKTIQKVNYQMGKNKNRQDNKVSGKYKKGAQRLRPNSDLCTISCSDGSEYTPRSCVNGNLLEVNDNLMDHPQLLTSKTSTDGYLAIIQVRKQDQETEMATLMSQEEYDLEISKKRGDDT